MGSLQANYAALLATTQQGSANTIGILEYANLPAAPIESNLPTNLLLGALLGVALAAVGAYLIEFFDDTFKESSELQESLGLPVLCAIPVMEKGTEQSKVVMNQINPVPAMEAYRLLRLNLEYVAV